MADENLENKIENAQLGEWHIKDGIRYAKYRSGVFLSGLLAGAFAYYCYRKTGNSPVTIFVGLASACYLTSGCIGYVKALKQIIKGGKIKNGK